MVSPDQMIRFSNTQIESGNLIGQKS